MAEQIIMLGRVVIPSDNTPLKGPGDTLVPSPVWKYKGPAITITLTYQVGRWGVGGFAGDTSIVTETLPQPACDDWAECRPTSPLRGVKLTGLHPSPDNRYDMEMWFKATGMADEAAIFTDCCEVPAAVPELEIVSCSFS
ncbi:hypothetical protein ES703_16011 [subsurface metagenome]